MALLFALSRQSGTSMPELAGWDKAVHAAAYFVLCVLCLRACHGGLGPVRLRPTLLAVALGLSYGLVDEVHQSFVPGRDPSALDWVADAVGVGLAPPLVGAIQARRPRVAHGAD
jgi:VanZ family protein